MLRMDDSFNMDNNSDNSNLDDNDALLTNDIDDNTDCIDDNNPDTIGGDGGEESDGEAAFEAGDPETSMFDVPKDVAAVHEVEELVKQLHTKSPTQAKSKLFMQCLFSLLCGQACDCVIYNWITVLITVCPQQFPIGRHSSILTRP